MGKLTRIDIACNDPDNGVFTGRAMGISYRGNELEPDAWGDGYALTVEWDQPRPARLRIHRKWFQFERSKYGVGNWCWDAFWMRPREAKRLLRHLRASGKWSCTSGLVRFSDWFDAPPRRPGGPQMTNLNALAARCEEGEGADREMQARAMIERFDLHRLRIADRRPSAKRDEFLAELDFIRRDMIAAALRALAAKEPNNAE